MRLAQEIRGLHRTRTGRRQADDSCSLSTLAWPMDAGLPRHRAGVEERRLGNDQEGFRPHGSFWTSRPTSVVLEPPCGHGDRHGVGERDIPTARPLAVI
jgi:hypothetical protein